MSKKKQKAAADVLVETDAAVLDAVAPWRETLPVRALSTFSKLGDQPPLRLLCGAAIASGLAFGNRRLTLAGARALAAHSLATGAKNFIKHRVDRRRPERFAGHGSGEKHKPEKGSSHEKQKTSFPSGHSAGAAAVARAFARDYPEHEAAALTAAGVIALAQIPRCAHFPTDVGAGLAIGVAAEAATSAALDAAAARLTNGREEQD